MSSAPIWDSSQKPAQPSWDSSSSQALPKGPSSAWETAQHQTRGSPSSSAGAGTTAESASNGTPSQQQASPRGADDSPPGAGDDASAEGVWSADIEQAFQEALAIYPPCGRRKIILSDEGKMYGRNELIARYIKLRTGKNRTRKQVSSHIQVLARKKSREIQTKIKDQATKEQALQGLASMSSAQIVSASVIHSKLRIPFGMSPMSALGMPGMIEHGIPQSSPSYLKQEMAPLMSPPAMWGHPALSQPMPHSIMGFGQPGLMAGPVVVSSGATPGGVAVMPTMTGLAGGTPVSHMTSNSPRSGSPVQRGSQFSRGNSPGDTAGAVSKLSLSPDWNGCSLAAPKLKLIEYDAFVETPAEDPRARKHSFIHLEPSDSIDAALEGVRVVAMIDFNDKFPDRKGGLKDLYDRGPVGAFFLVKFWADIDTNIPEDANAFYGVTSRYESRDNITIQCSTKVCSFGQQVVEKVETGHSTFEDGRFVFCIDRSPMCEYMISFIHKLQRLPEKYMMNSVLENFTVLQVVTNRDTQETLLCMACVFEVSMSDDGVRHKVFRLVGE